MAKGLKPGDTVSVAKPLKFKRASDVYKNGLHRVQPGDAGKVVDAADGRSVIVEFKGYQFKVASQRLQVMTPPPEPRRRGRKPGSTNKPKAPVETASVSQDVGDVAFVNYNDAQFVKKVANNLLMHSAAQNDPDAVVVQIKLSELPQPVQTQIRELMQAKLALGPQATIQPKRRGRKPKSQMQP